MRILSIHQVGGIILGACVLFLPHTVNSLDPPAAPCQNPEGCFAQFLKQLEKPEAVPGTLSDHARFFNQILT